MWNEIVRRGQARERVSEAVALEPEIERTLREVAAARGWEYHKEVSVSLGDDRRTEIDHILDTDYGKVLVEFAAIKRSPAALAQRIASLKAAMQRLEAWRGMLVVPDGGIHGTPDTDVTVVEASQLRDAVNQFP